MVDDAGELEGLITIKDIEKTRTHPNAAKDGKGRLLVRARRWASAPDREERIDALLKAGVDVIVVDTAHGHSRGVLDAVRDTAARTSRTSSSIAGNVATAEGTRGADRGRRGRGEGGHRARARICTTRVVAGVGRAADHRGGRLRPGGATARHPDHRRRRHQVLGRHRQGARRGRQHGDDRLALRRHRGGAGRGHPVPGPQLQELPRHGLARRDEAGRARTATSRATSTRTQKLVPEGIEGRVPYKGRLAIERLPAASAASAPAWATRAAAPSRSCGKNARFVRITASGPAREPRARRDHHRGGAELPRGVTASPDGRRTCTSIAEKVLILDFGSQYTQLIARRVRELGVYCEIHRLQPAARRDQRLRAEGIILSGGPSSVYERGRAARPTPASSISGCRCSASATACSSSAKLLGGQVDRADEREYGPRDRRRSTSAERPLRARFATGEASRCG